MQANRVLLRRLLHWIGIVLLALVGCAVGIVAVGWLTPAEHHTIGSTTVPVAPARVWEILTDVAAAPGWRSGLHRVEVMSAPQQPLVFREHGDFGALTLGVVESDPPRRLVTRILDENLGFGGTWTYELRPASGGTLVEIREDGRIDNLLFRGMTRLFFGTSTTIASYLGDLATLLGGDGEVVIATTP